jgi:hypothetical protein
MTLRPALRSLLQPCRPTLVCRHQGRIALVLAVLVAVPALFAYASGDSTLPQRLLLAALVPTLASAACALIPARNSPSPIWSCQPRRGSFASTDPEAISCSRNPTPDSSPATRSWS